MEAIKKIIAKTFLELAEGLETGHIGSAPTIALTGLGSEFGEENTLAGALEAARDGIKILYIGSVSAPEGSGVDCVYADCEDGVFRAMESALAEKRADAAVAMHYPFPIGVSTVGRALAPASGRQMYLATTTGTSSTERVEAMILNTIAGIACAKACGVSHPTVGLLNLDGTRQAEISLKELATRGYPIRFTASARADGGAVMRGNDVLLGTPDVMVSDSLTGNVLCKMLAAANSGGRYETQGYGYGPGIGQGYDKLVLIISRASGAPLIANAIRYAAQLVRGGAAEVIRREYEAAEKAGLRELLEDRRKKNEKTASREATPTAPPKEIVTVQIQGIDVMDLEDAVHVLWAEGIYAEDGMGCTGPIIRISESNEDRARALLVKAGFVSE